MQGTVSAVFSDRDEAARAVARLRDAGIRDEELRVVGGPRAARARETKSYEEALRQRESSTAAWTGTALGGAVGGILGLVMITLLPPVPLLILGGAAVGALIGGLGGLGVADHDVHETEEILRAGGVLVVVRGDATRQAFARKILRDTHAKSVALTEPVTPV